MGLGTSNFNFQRSIALGITLLVAMFLVSLVGCGDKKPPTPPPKPNASSDSDTDKPGDKPDDDAGHKDKADGTDVDKADADKADGDKADADKADADKADADKADTDTDSTEDKADADKSSDAKTKEEAADAVAESDEPKERAKLGDYLVVDIGELGGYNYDVTGDPFAAVAGTTDTDNADSAGGKTKHVHSSSARISALAIPTGAQINEMVRQANKQIPEDIKALDGMKVAMTGFMFPVDANIDETDTFMLVRSVPACFFCEPPKLNQWVRVEIKDQKVAIHRKGAVQITGVFTVGSDVHDGQITSVFRLEADGIKTKD
jgi:hypothetical protein